MRTAAPGPVKVSSTGKSHWTISLPAGTQLFHGVSQLTDLSLTGVSLLLDLLVLGSLLLFAFVDYPKSQKPREIGHDQNRPENLQLHRHFSFSEMRCRAASSWA